MSFNSQKGKGEATMPADGNIVAIRKVVLFLVLTAVWLLAATAPASAAFWFPLPNPPQSGNIPLPPVQVAPSSGPTTPIDIPGDVPPPESTPGVATTPEPASIVLGLMGAGAIGLARFWRRRSPRTSR